VPISQEALFKIALNLEDPWYITTLDFSAEGKQLDIMSTSKQAVNFLARNAAKQAATCMIL
jgi:hypothetical protein